MICRNCQNEAAYQIRTIVDGGEPLDSCDRCGTGGFLPVVDVYFDKAGAHHGLYDPQTGEPVYVTSKSHKAQVMCQQRVREAGDRVHGATSYDPAYARITRENFQKSLRKGD